MRISDWSSDVCSSDLFPKKVAPMAEKHRKGKRPRNDDRGLVCLADRVGNNGDDDAAADGDQDGVIPGMKPLVAEWGRPEMVSAGRVDAPESGRASEGERACQDV